LILTFCDCSPFISTFFSEAHMLLSCFWDPWVTIWDSGYDYFNYFDECFTAQNQTCVNK